MAVHCLVRKEVPIPTITRIMRRCRGSLKHAETSVRRRKYNGYTRTKTEKTEKTIFRADCAFSWQNY